MLLWHYDGWDLLYVDPAGKMFLTGLNFNSKKDCLWARSVGKFKDDPKLLRRAAEYLEDRPCVL
jgi:hypothetical protein